MKFLSIIFLLGSLMGEKAHECADITWVNLDTVIVDGKPLNTLPVLSAMDISGSDINLVKNHAQGDNILILSYIAEWCKNCHYDAPQAEKIYSEFKALGLEIAVIMEYSTMEGAMNFINKYKLSMPVYFGRVHGKEESKRHLADHYALRKALADERGWGTPFHIIIEKGNLEKVGFITGEFKPRNLKRYLAHQLLIE